MPTRYKAACFYGARNIRIEHLPIPTLGPNDVLIKVKAANVCQTDVRKYLGLDTSFANLRECIVLGHEGAGVVDAVGENVKSVEVEDRVVPIPAKWCGKCKFCISGRPELCSDRLGIGAGVGGPERCLKLLKEEGIGGTFAEYLKIPESQVLKVPPEVSLEAATFTEPLADVIKAQEEVNARIGDIAVIIGLGPMGLLHVQAMRIHEVSFIIGVDPIKDRREKALRYGCKVTLDPSAEDPVRKIKELTRGVGADIIMVAAGGKAQAPCTQQALRMASKGGRICIFAGTYPSANISIDPNIIHYNELLLTGSFAYHVSHFLEALKLMRQKKVEVESLRSPVYPIDEIKDALEAYGTLQALKVGISMN